MDRNYWKNAESINGRLAMIGLFAAIINYGFTGWMAPGIFQGKRVPFFFWEGKFDL